MQHPFIGGRTVERHRSPIEVLDPATGRVVDTTPACTAEDVDQAVATALEAFRSWSTVPAARRGALLGAAARHVAAAIDDLAPVLTAENGKPLREARLELRRAVETLEHYAGLAHSLRGGSVPDLDDGAQGLIVRRPMGVVGAIVPWNFPTTLLCNKLGPAVLAGNTVVAKPAETTPLTTLRLAALLHEGGLPAGVVNIVTGTGPECGAALVAHPDVRKVAFTGSTPVGKQTMAAAAQHLKRVTLELGGSDPLIICDDADVDAAVSAASMGRFFNCGQACLAVKRLFVFDRVAEEVVDKLLAKVAKLRLGAGGAEGTMLGPLHSARGRALVGAQVEESVRAGGKLLHGGRAPQDDELAGGFFYEPTLVLEPPRDSPMAQQEVFGPALPVWRVGDWDEAVQRANDSPFGLGSSVWTSSHSRAQDAALRIEAGYTWINSRTRVYDELPFGGLKQSGYGKEHGEEALDFYLETKSVVVRG